MSRPKVVAELRGVKLFGALRRSRTERLQVARAVGDLVHAAHDRPPRPHAALAALLERGVGAPGLSADTGEAHRKAAEAQRTAADRTAEAQRKAAEKAGKSTVMASNRDRSDD